jgi:hypothetical protein
MNMVLESAVKLEKENKILKEVLTMTFHFMSNEADWEFWRAEHLYFKDEDKPKQTTSQINAETLRRFIRDMAQKHSVVAETLKQADDRCSN